MVRRAVYALPALAGVWFLVVTFIPALQNFRHGFPTYYVSARLLWEGRWTPQVYDNAWFAAEVQARTPNGVGEVFAPNPPSTALIMLPLAWLEIVLARHVWLWLSLAALLVTLALLARHIGPGRLWARAVVLTLPFLYAPLHENFRLANVYGVLLLLFTLTLVGWQRPAGAGMALGVAAGAKLSGSPLWLVLAARGRWHALAWAAGAALLLVALSVGVQGAATWQRYVSVLLEHAGEPGWAAGLAFQTTPSFFQHLFRPDATWNPQPLWVLPAWVARACTLVVSAAALGALAWRARTAALDLAVALAVTLAVIVLPFAEEYHYALLVLPLAVAVKHVAGAGRWWSTVWLGLAFLLLAGPWPYKDPWLNVGWHALLGYPRLYGGWLLAGWLLRAMTPERSA